MDRSLIDVCWRVKSDDFIFEDLTYSVSVVVGYKIKNLDSYKYLKFNRICEKEFIETCKDEAERFVDSIPKQGKIKLSVMSKNYREHGVYDNKNDEWVFEKDKEKYGESIGTLELEYEDVFIVTPDIDKTLHSLPLVNGEFEIGDIID